MIGVNMARPQTFNKEMVLDSAMQLFWLKGFANTSVKDLTKVTKLQPGSIYGAFKNKRNLFLMSLDYYFENLYSSVNCILQSSEPPLKRIRLFFDHLLSQKDEDKALKSCLLVNTLLEIPPDDSEINSRISYMFTKIENEFCSVLKLAQQEGTLSTGGRPETLAKMLMSGIFGLQVYNRMKPDHDALLQIVNNLLANLEK
ncbi:MAG: TetR/AcrR family transcriptional regulator [Gammaproteobacteria bacterium]|nr:TetR/AcrR family transcriptional regulator [Gammaproteobacteria bacterium]